MARPRGSLGGAGGAPEVAMTSCSITLARPVNGTLVKTITVEGGKVTSKRPSPNYLEFVFVEQEVCGLEDLYEAVIAGASLGWIVVRGKPKNPRGRRAIYEARRVRPGSTWCRALGRFDWDNLPLEPVDDRVPDPLRDPEIGVALAMMRLPPAFREVSCIWQISAGAGLAPGFRMRTWHWLDRPCLGVDLKEWVRPSIDRGLVDPCTLVEVQPHYLAVRVVGGPDPCPARFGIGAAPVMPCRCRTSPGYGRSGSAVSGWSVPREPPFTPAPGGAARATPASGSASAWRRSEPRRRVIRPTGARRPERSRSASDMESTGRRSGRP